MTVERGEPWGREIPAPADAVVARTDREVVPALTNGRAVALGGGDLARTVGAPRIAGSATMNELPIDLIEATLDGGEVHRACAHVIARPPWWRGGWLRGPVLAVMNAEFVGSLDVAPRGHPNDGRVEVVEIDARMGARERLEARRRARTAGHVPHPSIRQRPVRTQRWSFERPLVILVDGQRVGSSRTIGVVVVADAATVLG